MLRGPEQIHQTAPVIDIAICIRYAGPRTRGLQEINCHCAQMIRPDYRIRVRLFWRFTEKECSRIDAVMRSRGCGLWVDEALQSQLAALRYPICFVDFETVAPAVPRFIGMKPYEPIPIQWSAHRQASAGGILEHSAFLSTDSEDPRWQDCHHKFAPKCLPPDLHS